jgi:hypothetical protein
MPITVDQQAALNLAANEGQANALQTLFDRAADSKANFWAVVDFNKPSSEERLYVFDLRSQSVKKYLVAHGKKSGLELATVFSNTVGSNCSSLGVYKTAETYIGKHGKSLRINGLDETNSNARPRKVVVHSADYVVPNYKGTGRAGRSDGCFAVNPSVIAEVIANLKGGSYINAWRL